MNNLLRNQRTGPAMGAAAICRLVLCCAALAQSPMTAGQTSPDAAGARFASVLRQKGDVVAIAGGTERALHEGDLLYVGEHIRAGAAAEAVLKTDDAGMIAVRPGTEFVPERFSALGAPTDNSTLRLVVGSLRIITGWIGRANRSNNRLFTPTATIGIRGTDHEPYVLTADIRGESLYRQGTYDKVNRGGTSLEAEGQSLEIDAGKVGFARSAGDTQRTRALLTLLLPVLLEKVPAFYVPGAFDDELDKYSESAADVSRQQLEQKNRRGAAAAPKQCTPLVTARTWLGQLDRAIARRDGDAVVAMFAPDVTVKANVRNKDGSKSSLDLSRDELVQSALTAVKTLSRYSQRRISIAAKAADPADAPACESISVTSVVIESGRQSGKPYRFESREDYLLQLRSGKWLAAKAETTQR